MGSRGIAYLGMVGRPAHHDSPQVDVVQLAGSGCARVRGALVTIAILKERLIAAGMVPWSPAGMSGSLPKMEVMGTT